MTASGVVVRARQQRLWETWDRMWRRGGCQARTHVNLTGYTGNAEGLAPGLHTSEGTQNGRRCTVATPVRYHSLDP
jgi:hypothetical protein